MRGRFDLRAMLPLLPGNAQLDAMEAEFAGELFDSLPGLFWSFAARQCLLESL